MAKNPKFIFTSNSFEFDEYFKFYTAKTEEGVKYFVGQHGANYGTYKYSKKWTEITTCDKFISWGWENIYKNVETLPSFNFTVTNLKNIKYNNKGSLLLIKRGPGYQNGPYDRRFKHFLYQQDTLSFYDKCEDKIKKEFIVRLHHGSSDFKSNDEDMWRKKDKDIKISLGYNPIKNLIKKSRLLVITYDSASVLEFLTLNIPIVCFWRDPLSSLLKKSIPYYQSLMDVGILHSDYISATSHINNKWNDIESWWLSTKVQKVREKFVIATQKK